MKLLALLILVGFPAMAANINEVSVNWFLKPASEPCTSSDVRTGGAAATADIYAYCPGEFEAEISVSAHASPLQVYAFGNINQHAFSDEGLPAFLAEIIAYSNTLVFISGGNGAALVEFLLTGGTSVGSISIHALGGGGSAGGESLTSLGPLPFTFGERFEISLSASSAMSSHIFPFADADLKVDGIRVTDLDGNVLPAVLHIVPEPGTWLRMLAGLGAVGWRVRLSSTLRP